MEPYEVTQYTSRTHRAPFGRSLPASGRETARPSQVSWFGWHGRFLVPAIRSMSADGAAGSRIAEGNRHRQREASLKRTIHPRDHGVTAGVIHGLAHGLPGLLRRTRKFSAGDQKRLDPEHSRYGGGPGTDPAGRAGRQPLIIGRVLLACAYWQIIQWSVIHAGCTRACRPSARLHPT